MPAQYYKEYLPSLSCTPKTRMIADDELQIPLAEPATVHGAQGSDKRRSPVPAWALFLGFLSAIVVLQVLSGAYRCEFGAYPDEPAHYVTSLMLRDYVLHFHFQSPMRFAEDYYQHYPKVAFGHWPPVFYILQSFWMMLFSVSRTSVRLEIAVTSALLGYAMFREVRRRYGLIAGVLAGFLIVILPSIQDFSDQEMAEALLALLCFGSVVAFSRYMELGRPIYSWLFGVFFSMAVLTKGSGWLLALVLPLAIVLGRRLDLVKRIHTWSPVAFVAITCVPWQMMTMRMAERGWDGGTKPSVDYTLNALAGFLGLFPKLLGPVFVIFLLAGIWNAVAKPLWRGRVQAADASQFALIVSVWVFHSLVPAGVEDRKLALAVPAMIWFVVGGGRFLADLLPRSANIYPRRYALVAGVGAAAFFITTFTVPKLRQYGFVDAARFLTQRDDLRNATVLVSSEAGGEGLLISEIGMQRSHPANIVIRATKALANVGWSGGDYHPLYSTPQQILNYLHTEHVQVVVLDTFAPLNRFAHNALIRSAITSSGSYHLVAIFPSSDSKGEVQIFKVN